MKVLLAYGKTGLNAEIPDANLKKIMRMKHVAGIENPAQCLHEMLLHPIASPSLLDCARGKKSAVIIISDVTRPVPNSIILPPIMDHLHSAGMKKEQITILIATGLHRPNVGEELHSMVGEQIFHNYCIINHYANDASALKFLGTTGKGTPVYINTHYVNADLKITTGYIEPHIFAGFSGGRKLISPGIAGAETIKQNHSPRFLEDARCCEGNMDDNPLHEDLLEISEMTGCDFIVNVSLNESKDIIGIFAGHPIEAHRKGVAFVQQNVRDTIQEPADIVVTTCAGYPLDTTFYQAIKGLTAALPVVKKGGSIILAASCTEGLGDSAFTGMVRDYYDMNRFIAHILQANDVMINQWQYEELGKVLGKAKVFLFSDGIPAQDRPHLPVTIIPSVEQGIEHALRRYGANASIVVIPKGPYILAGIDPS